MPVWSVVPCGGRGRGDWTHDVQGGQVEPAQWQMVVALGAGVFAWVLVGVFVSALRLGEDGESAGGVGLGLLAGLATGFALAGVPVPGHVGWFGMGVLAVTVGILFLAVRRLEGLAASLLKELPVRDALDGMAPGHGDALARQVGPGIRLGLRLSVGLFVLSWFVSMTLPGRGVLDAIASLVHALLTAGLAALIVAIAVWRWHRVREAEGSALDVAPWVVLVAVLLAGGPFLLVVAAIGLGLTWALGGAEARSALATVPVLLTVGASGGRSFEVDGVPWRIGAISVRGAEVDRGEGTEQLGNDVVWEALRGATPLPLLSDEPPSASTDDNRPSVG